MASWFPVSQLLLIALLSWNVHCFPAKKGWSQHDPYEGSFSNMEVRPGLHYSSSQGAPTHPSSVSYPVSFREEGGYSSHGTYPTSSSPSPDMSSVTSWNAATGFGPMEESTTASGTSQPTPNIGLPLPPFFQAGELDQYEVNLEHGSSERESEELSFPPPPPPFPEFGFQAGEMSRYESIFEHGNEERETEDQGFMPLPPYAPGPQGAPLSAVPVEEGPEQPAPQKLSSLGPNMRHLFLTGQLPPGTYSLFQSDYETGGDHWDEAHYERYHFPIAQSPVITETQQPQDFTKI